MACDISLGYFLTLAWLCFFKPPFHCSVMGWIMIVTSIYFIVCQVFLKRSLFQYLLQLKPAGNPWKYTGTKLLLLTIAPLMVAQCHPWLVRYVWEADLAKNGWEMMCGANDWLETNNAMLLCMSVWLIPLLLAELLTFASRKESVAEWISDTTLYHLPEKQPMPPSVLLLLLFVCLMLFKPMREQRLKRQYYPTVCHVTPKFPPAPLFEQLRLARSFNKAKQSPESIMDEMFKRYDIVVFTERYHPEYTQWEFLSRYIASEKFAREVGHLSTEYGRLDQQQELDRFLHTAYPADSLAQMAAAQITRSCISWWPIFTNRNLFDFLMLMNRYNTTHDSSLQIQWDFTHHDRILDRPARIFDTERINDSIMGTNIVQQYRRQTAKDTADNKRLVILNNYHSYKGILHQKSAIDYIMDSLPEQTGVVFLTTSSVSCYTFILPTAMGLWDEAARRCGYPFGVMVDQCVLKDERYDGWQAPDRRGKRKVSELFDAVLFLNHPTDFYWDENGFPYLFRDFEDEFVQNCKNAGMEHYLPLLENYHRQGGDILPRHHPAVMEPYNRIYDLLYYLLAAIPVICLFLQTAHSHFVRKK